jgi:hypothetical protein
LLEEVSYLSARNSQIEETLLSFEFIKAESMENKKQVEVLLVLLGEKEEELEGLLHDMNEVKHLYKSHIEELMQQVAPVVLDV